MSAFKKIRITVKKYRNHNFIAVSELCNDEIKKFFIYNFRKEQK